MGIFDFFSKDLAIDLGTANTLIYIKGKGIVLNEPSMVAIRKDNGEILAIGHKAKYMFGKTPDSIVAIRPMKDGVIADFEITQLMIRNFIRKAIMGINIVKPTVMVCIPSGITQVEKKAVIEAAFQAGARKVELIEEPMAAAIGARLPIEKPLGNMIVDIGGGTTEVAVISMYAVAYSESIRVAGDEMDEAITHYIKKKFYVQIGGFEAERLKIEIGSAFPLKQRLEAKVKGRHITEGRPVAITVDDRMVREALEEPVQAIISSIKRALERSTPELAADISERGIVLAGGVALLRGLGMRIHKETGLKVFRVKDPLTAVVKGTGQVLEDFKRLHRVCVS